MVLAAKICGLANRPTLDVALDCGTGYVGFVFFAKSPRNVSLEAARALAERARGRARIVALTVDADDAALDAIVAQVAPDVLQLHGDESPERVADVRTRTGTSVWKAIPVETVADVERAFAYQGIADLILFDAKAPKGSRLPGGNGHTFDWRMLDGVRGRIPFMLSGGLTPGNVGVAVAATGAMAVDVSSGVESAPGVKDAELICAFLEAVKTARSFS